MRVLVNITISPPTVVTILIMLTPMMKPAFADQNKSSEEDSNSSTLLLKEEILDMPDAMDKCAKMEIKLIELETDNGLLNDLNRRLVLNREESGDNDCPDYSWTSRNGICYKDMGYSAAFHDGINYCSKVNAQAGLPFFQSADEWLDFLDFRTFGHQLRSEGIVLGVIKKANQNLWLNIGGIYPQKPWLHWGPNEPRKVYTARDVCAESAPENCSQRHHHKVQTIPCNDARRVVCQLRVKQEGDVKLRSSSSENITAYWLVDFQP